MQRINFRSGLMAVIILLTSVFATAQPGEKRIQYPWGLKNAYFGLSMGYINYPFSSAQLEPGFTVQSVSVPHIAPRITLFGYQFNKYLSAQITYMRPVDWIIYKNVNGNTTSNSVWMNVGGLTVAGQLPIAKKFSLFAEAGLGIITRKGFDINYVDVVKSATFATGLFGGALKYHLNRKWDLLLSTTWSPADAKDKQPATTFYSAGFNYHLKELSKEKVKSNIKIGYYFAKHFIQASYTTNALSYGVNDLFSKTLIDNEKTGKKFTFYDAMGIGMFTGKKKNLNAGLRIAHFSNGNIFSQNNGVKVPLTLSFGYVLK